MPTAADVAELALQSLLNELDVLPAEHIDRVEPLDDESSARVGLAISEAMTALAAADRLALLDAATQRLAVACVHREIPQPVRAAAYSALVGLIASDLLPQPMFRTLYAAWDELDDAAQSSAVPQGEEILLHIE